MAKDYWLRWYYGKPDIPRTTPPDNFKFFDYYPDGTNGDWSATGVWNDSMCAPKPPATPVTVGFPYGGWFPYKGTEYKYPYGASLAYIYPDPATVQDLLNAFTFERYLIWRDNYVTTTDTVCGAGTARIQTDPPKTVSEGQGYGMAISAAIGDKPTFDDLWNFVRHYLSQSSKKYSAGSWAGCGMAASRAGNSTRLAISTWSLARATRTAPSTATSTSASVWCTRPCSGPSTHPRPSVG